MSIIGIAEQFHRSRTTVRKLVAAGAFPERAPTLRRKSVLNPSASYVEQRVLGGCHHASLLWRDIHAQGFPGGEEVA
jgi:transposase